MRLPSDNTLYKIFIFLLFTSTTSSHESLQILYSNIFNLYRVMDAPLMIAENTIPMVNTAKLLGVYLDTQLNFHCNVDKIVPPLLRHFRPDG